MDDLISRAAAIEYLMTNMGWHDDDGYEVEDADEKRKVITDLVNRIPAVDAVPVVHGHWIDQCGDFECSECHTIIDSETLWYYSHSYYQLRDDFAYCPSCGAKMDGERRDDNARVSEAPGGGGHRQAAAV